MVIPYVVYIHNLKGNYDHCAFGDFGELVVYIHNPKGNYNQPTNLTDYSAFRFLSCLYT